MGYAIGFGQGRAHLPEPTCIRRFKTKHHTARWGTLITGEAIPRRFVVPLVPISPYLNYTSQTHRVASLIAMPSDFLPTRIKDRAVHE